MIEMQKEKKNDHHSRSDETPLNYQLRQSSEPEDLIDESPHFQKIVSASAVNGGMRDIPEFKGKDWLKFKRRIQTAFKVAKIHTYLHHHPREGSRIELYNDDIAKGLIEQKLDDAQYELVKDATYAKDAWEILMKANDKRAQLKENDLWIKYLEHRLKPDQSIKTYLDEITSLWHQLKAHKNNITEHGLCVKVLHGLRDTYESTKDAAIASEVENIETLRNLLLSAERGKKTKEEHVKALRAEAQKSKKENQNRKHKCWKCKTNRHSANECWKLHPELKPQQDQTSQKPKATRAQANTAAAISPATPNESEIYGWVAEARLTANQGIIQFDNHDPDYVPQEDDMMIDCGANLSMTNERSILVNYQNLRQPIKVGTSNGQLMHAVGHGQLHLFNGRVTLPNVLFVPNVERTLLATKSFSKQGYEIRIQRRMRILDHDKNLIYQPKEHNDLYFIPKKFIATITAMMAVTLQQAHQRFGHASSERLRHLNSTTTGLKVTGTERDFCKACALGKSRAKPFPTQRTTKPTYANQIISSDLKGPLMVTGKGEYRYYITFNDLYSTWCHVDFLQRKSASEVLRAVKKFFALAESETNQKTTIFLTDNGSEYVNTEMSNYLLQQKITHQRTAPYCPQQNGSAERRNQTLMGMARCVLIESNLHHSYWPFAIKYAAYTLNRLPTRSQEWNTPFEAWHKRKPSVKHLRPFGCIGYSHRDKSLRESALDTTSQRCIFLGYSDNQKAFILERTSDQRPIISRNVNFAEQEYESKIDSQSTETTEAVENDPLQEDGPPESDIACFSSKASDENPTSYAAAMATPEREQWHQAAAAEIQAHKENNTWTLVDRPKNAKVIKGRWVFSKKHTAQGKKHKARFVAKGFTQTAGVDYHETFASVLTQTSLRFLIILAITFGWPICQKDFTTAYLNAILTLPLYMFQPEGFAETGGGARKVCLLNKALYGLRQAGRAWQHALFDALHELEFQQSQKEPCIWFKRTSSYLILIGIYVDDLVITGSDSDQLEKISNELGKRFKMKHLGDLREFLGIRATRTVDSITLDQTTYIEQIVKQFGMTDAANISTPMDATYHTTLDDEKEDKYPTREAIGCLTYIANATRPDISFAVNNLARHVSHPTKRLWNAIKRIIRYLKTTKTIGLTFRKSNLALEAWADSDFAGDLHDRKSTSGWALTIGGNTVAWKSQKQKAVSLSTTEAEYIAACEASKEAIWLRDLLQELKLAENKVTLLNQDNQSAIFLEKNHSVKQRSKHIDIKYHFIRDLVQQGSITIRYCPTHEMTADMLTKPLSKLSFTKHRDTLMNIVKNNSDDQNLPDSHRVRSEEEC